MNGVIYRVSEEKIASGDGVRTAYGVVAESDSMTVLASFDDLFSEREIVESFVEACNREELSLLHIGEAIYDLLAS